MLLDPIALQNAVGAAETGEVPVARAIRAYLQAADLIPRELAMRACDPLANTPADGATEFMFGQAAAAQHIQGAIRQIYRLPAPASQSEDG